MAEHVDTRIYASTPMGEYEITEGVQALYDLLVQSMDFGSGFLSEDELIPVFKAAIAAGFDTSEIEEYLASGAAAKRMDLWRGQDPQPPRAGLYWWKDPAYKEWDQRRRAARDAFKAEEIAALRRAYGL